MGELEELPHVDGFTVRDTPDGQVEIVLSNAEGYVEQRTWPAEDALELGRLLVTYARRLLAERP